MNLIDNEAAILLLKALGRKKPTLKQIELASQLFSTINVKQQLFLSSQLTRAEAKCLILAAKGLTTANIASLLHLKKTTVQTHRKNILRKLACKTFPEAVLKGLQFGYLQPMAE